MGGAPLTPPADTVVENLLDARFSCRAFLDRRVDDSTIERILDLARRSPSWCNTQPWHVHVTRDAGTDRLRREARSFAREHPPEPDVPFPVRYEGVYRERRRECGWQLYESVGIARGDRDASAAQALENFEFFGAPHVAIVTTERDLGAYGMVDCGVYVAAFILAAQSLGVATIPQAALAAVAPAIRRVLELPDNRMVVCGISFGYAEDAHRANGFRTSRAAITDSMTWVI